MKRTALVNLPGHIEQPYKSWKGNTINSSVPSNSFYVPLSTGPTLPPNTPYKIKQNPIKHWRKQLDPQNENIGGKVGVSQVMDTPGGSVTLKKSADCNKCQYSIKTYILNNEENKYLSKDNNPNVCCQKKRITRPGTTILPKNYYTTSTAYLKSRVKLYNQNQSIVPKKNINYYEKNTNGENIYIFPSDSTNGSQVYNSIYCSDLSCGTVNYFKEVIYKPNNYNFSKEGAVSSDLRMTKLKVQEINKNAKSLENKFGQYTANAAKYNGYPGAPLILKTKYVIPKKAQCLANKTANTHIQPSGGSGRHTICARTNGSDIKTNLSGSVLLKSKTPGSVAKGQGSWAKGPVLPQKNECQLILESLGKIREQKEAFQKYEPDDKNIF